jgi:hypothetical protein
MLTTAPRLAFIGDISSTSQRKESECAEHQTQKLAARIDHPSGKDCTPWNQ